MIPRYTLPEMGALWSEQNKFQKWLDVEIAVCEVHAEMGTIPHDALEQIKARAHFSVERINEIEKTTNHDVIAFTTNLAESIGEASRFVHYGLTSSDVVDTANALLLRDSVDILLRKVETLLETLKRRALEFKNTPQVGRTHGIHAEPITFGFKIANWYSETQRNIARFMAAAED
ncbi:MAG TPA: lyase family protein, partial [Pyrinomonadaceae bacterium]|nr:lyase family protein [Pyrinomonadaceae bacterium]